MGIDRKMQTERSLRAKPATNPHLSGITVHGIR